MLAALLFAVAAKFDHDYYSCQASSPAEEQNPENSGHKEFIIWESFSRSLMASVKF